MAAVIGSSLFFVIITLFYLGAIRIEAEDFDWVRLNKLKNVSLATYFETPAIIRILFDWPLIFILCLTLFPELPQGSRSRYLCRQYMIGFLVLAAEIVLVNVLIYLEYGRL